MMKNIYYYIRLVSVLLLAGATFVSCNKEKTISGTFTMTVNATKGDSHAKNLSPDETGKPVATWAQGEEVTVFNVTTGQPLTGTLVAQRSGPSTILSGDITGSISVGDQLELRFLSPNYRIQNGTLAGIGSVCDYAKATVTASVSDQSVTTFPKNVTFENQQAIVKFTLQNSSSQPLNASTFVVRVGDSTYSVMPATATNELYVAIHGFNSQTVSIAAKVGTAWYNFDQPNVTFANSQYYTITLRMEQKGFLPGAYSVSENLKVSFSPGNLQYQASTQTWRFALNQKDYVGDDYYGNVDEGGVKCSNTKISNDYAGWIDLFGWGTSNANNEGDCHPYNTSENASHYGPISGDLVGDNAVYDWGVKNPISNGGNAAGMWRTLTSTEWDYLLNTRQDSRGINTPRFIKARIGGNHCGLIIFPDNYVHPAGAGELTYLNTNAGWTPFRETAWDSMEAAGAIFLPAAGYRDGVSVASVTSEGVYWSATSASNNEAHRVLFSNSGTGDYSATNATQRYYGYSVRLVRDLQ